MLMRFTDVCQIEIVQKIILCLKVYVNKKMDFSDVQKMNNSVKCLFFLFINKLGM